VFDWCNPCIHATTRRQTSRPPSDNNRHTNTALPDQQDWYVTLRTFEIRDMNVETRRLPNTDGHRIMNGKYCNDNINNYYWRKAEQIKMNTQQYRRRNGMKFTNI